jgi:Tfp pilus assembly protein PilO
MISREVFLQRSWTWWVPLIFVVLAVSGIVFYQAAFAGEAAVLEKRLESRETQLGELRKSRREIEGFLEKARTQSDTAGILYRDHFSTEDQRFTRLLREVRDLAGRSGLRPTAFSYPENKVEEHGLVRRNVNFGVTGTYDQLRTFINFLELTDQFLSLESVDLGGGAAERNPELRIRLSLATYFVEDESKIGIDDVSFGSSVNEDEAPASSGSDGEDADESNEDPGSEETASEAATEESTAEGDSGQGPNREDESTMTREQNDE